MTINRKIELYITASITSTARQALCERLRVLCMEMTVSHGDRFTVDVEGRSYSCSVRRTELLGPYLLTSGRSVFDLHIDLNVQEATMAANDANQYQRMESAALYPVGASL